MYYLTNSGTRYEEIILIFDNISVAYESFSFLLSTLFMLLIKRKGKLFVNKINIFPTYLPLKHEHVSLDKILLLIHDQCIP